MTLHSPEHQGILAATAEPITLPKTLAPLPQIPNYDDPAPAPSISRGGSETAAAIFHRNSSTSPFLRLPFDIRRELYKAVLGDKLIHIRLAMGPISSRPWRHVICQRGHPKHFQPEQKESLAQTQVADDWETPHRLCKWETYYDPKMVEGSNYWDNERMHLTMLRCCRQFYTEANAILWSTNTFSIHDHHTMKQFMLERTATQKSCIRKLRLRFDLKQTYLHYRRSFLTADWMQSLSGLHNLTLILEDEFPARLVHSMAMTGKSLTEFGGNRIDAGLEKLSLLPLKTLFVEVLSTPSPTGTEDPLTEAWKKEYAEGVRNYLLGRVKPVNSEY